MLRGRGRNRKNVFCPWDFTLFIHFLSVTQITCKQANYPLIGNSCIWTTILVVPMTIFYFRTARSLSKKILGQEYFHPIFFSIYFCKKLKSHDGILIYLKDRTANPADLFALSWSVLKKPWCEWNFLHVYTISSASK